MASSLGTPYKRNAILETIKTQGVDIPRLGFGTLQMPGGEVRPVVESAIALSFCHIDAAVIYKNATTVGAAIAVSGVKRAKLFVTTKVWPDQLSPDAFRRAFDISLGKLGLDYVDCYMILVALHERGLMRMIGAPIATRQVEYPPFLSQAQMLAYLPYLHSKAIPLTADAPLAQDRTTNDAALAVIGRRHGTSATQAAIAWLLDQKGIIVIPKASQPAGKPKGHSGRARQSRETPVHKAPKALLLPPLFSPQRPPPRILDQSAAFRPFRVCEASWRSAMSFHSDRIVSSRQNGCY
jgi:2,5-diketo-D-gluconate reductase B